MPNPHLTPIKPTYRPPTHHRETPVYVFDAAELTALISLMGELDKPNPIPREFYREQTHEFLQRRKFTIRVTPESVAEVALMIKANHRHLIPHAILKAHVPQYVTESGEVIPTTLEKATAQVQALFPHGKTLPQETPEEVTFRPNVALNREHFQALKSLPKGLQVEVTNRPHTKITLRVKQST
jgi:hypothetical protein